VESELIIPVVQHQDHGRIIKINQQQIINKDQKGIKKNIIIFINDLMFFFLSAGVSKSLQTYFMR
jgi:hypothetical protein